MDINDIIKAVLSGAAQQGGMPGGGVPPAPGAPRVPGLEIPAQDSTPTSAPDAGAGNIGDILGAILGGGAPQQPTGGMNQPPMGGGGVGDILGAILGGGAPQQPTGGMNQPPMGGGGVGDILGAIMGGGGSYASNNTFLAPTANLLAQKLGIPPSLALIIVSFAMTKLLAAHANGGSHGAFEVNHLMEHLNSEDGVDADFVRSSGMVAELAEQTGLSKRKATQSLQQAFNLIGGQVSGGGEVE